MNLECSFSFVDFLKSVIVIEAETSSRCGVPCVPKKIYNRFLGKESY